MASLVLSIGLMSCLKRCEEGSCAQLTAPSITTGSLGVLCGDATDVSDEASVIHVNASRGMPIHIRYPL